MTDPIRFGDNPADLGAPPEPEAAPVPRPPEDAVVDRGARHLARSSEGNEAICSIEVLPPYRHSE